MDQKSHKGYDIYLFIEQIFVGRILLSAKHLDDSGQSRLRALKEYVVLKGTHINPAIIGMVSFFQGNV